MKCLICGCEGKKIFKGKILQKHMVQYFQCSICGLIYTEKPFWLEDAYKDSITNIDTGMMQRTVDNVLITNTLIESFYTKKSVCLDYGGGYGIFTRMMRDLGYNWKWYDKYSENFAARGFEYKQGENIALITAFELFEHFDEPMLEIENLFSISDTILFSTLIYDNNLRYPNFNNWWYYVPETGQHISFYSKKTLEYIAKKFKVNYYMLDKGMHLFTNKKIDKKKLKVLFNSKIAKTIQYCQFAKNRNKGLASKDMRMILQMRKKHEKYIKENLY